MDDREKAVLAAGTMRDFFQQFGGPNEKFTFDLISILLEELYNAKNVCLLSEQIEERCEDSDDTSIGNIDQLTANGLRGIRASESMENDDRKDIK